MICDDPLKVVPMATLDGFVLGSVSASAGETCATQALYQEEPFVPSLKAFNSSKQICGFLPLQGYFHSRNS
eukprot:469150-Pleurochrysis_carterae.AAC.1